MHAKALRRLYLLFVLGLVALAFGNSFRAPFVFDDLSSIVDNPSLQRLWPPSSALLLPHDNTEAGRPVLNLSLALNQAVPSRRLAGFHLVNLGIHLAAVAVLFGLARRTLRPFTPEADAMAAAIALLWGLHPLQTESVTYVIQRAESLMGLWYLLTLYAFARSTDTAARQPRFWQGVAAAACAAGMATKEVMVSAPLVVLLYDRTFVARSFRAAWRERRRFYFALAATWTVLAGCVAMAGNRNGSAGFHLGVLWWQYALVQLQAVPHYLRLAIWPSPLVFYYGPCVAPNFTLALWPTLGGAAVVLALLVGTGWALVRRPPLGFLGAAFFLILAPSSSIVPVATEPVAEHRMYLPLAGVLVLLVLVLRRCGRLVGVAVMAAAALACAFATHARNEVYRSALSLWQDTVEKRPQNFAARNNWGVALQDAGDLPRAAAEFRRALELQPAFPDSWVSLGRLAYAQGRDEEAEADFRRALQLSPDYAEAHNDLGSVLLRQPAGRSEAEREFHRALALRPAYAAAQNNLGNALAGDPARRTEALAHYRSALYLNPDYAEAHYNLANLLAQDPATRGEAIGEYRRALAADPALERARYNLGNAWAAMGHGAEARAEYRRALALDPNDAQAHFALATLCARDPGQRTEAIAEFRAALRINPRFAAAHANLGAALFQQGQPEAAIAETELALQCDPSLEGARRNLAAFRSALRP